MCRVLTDGRNLLRWRDVPPWRPRRIVIKSKVVAKVALFRSQTVSATHEMSLYQNQYGDTAPLPDECIQPGMTFAIYSPIITRMTSHLGLPAAWVVKCKKCGCTVNCRAIDPQIEHAQPEKAEPPPHETVIMTCACCWSAYRYSPAEVFKGQPGPSTSCLANRSSHPGSNNKETRNPNSVLLIAASLIAAVRLNREEIKSSPAVYSKIADSIRLAEMIQARLRG